MAYDTKRPEPLIALRVLTLVRMTADHPYYRCWPVPQRRGRHNREFERGQKHCLHDLGMAFVEAVREHAGCPDGVEQGLVGANRKQMARLEGDLTTVMDTSYEGTGPHRCAMRDCLRVHLRETLTLNRRFLVEHTHSTLEEGDATWATFQEWVSEIARRIEAFPQVSDGVFPRIQTRSVWREINEAFAQGLDKQMLYVGPGQIRLSGGHGPVLNIGVGLRSRL